MDLIYVFSLPFIFGLLIFFFYCFIAFILLCVDLIKYIMTYINKIFGKYF